jgi:cytoskeletal protein CcmA (bactofilin family)
MKHSVRLVALLAFCCVGVLALLPTSAFAEGSHDRTQVGHDISVGSDQEVGELTCFGCSIRVRGHVHGDVTAFGGSVTIEDQGEVDGDASIFAGQLRLGHESKINGDVAIFGGRIRRDASATIGGDVAEFTSPLWLVLMVVLPLAVLGGMIALVVWLIRRFARPGVPAVAQ